MEDIIAGLIGSEAHRTFTFIPYKGKQKIIVNASFKTELCKLLSSVIEFLYNSFNYSFGYTDLNAFGTSLKVSIDSTCESLKSWQQGIDVKIMSTTLNIEKFRQDYENLKSGILPVVGTIPVSTFTQINQDFKNSIEAKAKYREQEVELIKLKEYNERHLSNLKKRKDSLNSTDFEKMNQITMDLLEVTSYIQRAKNFNDVIYSIKSLKDYLYRPDLTLNLKYELVGLNTLINLLLSLKSKNSHFTADLVGLDHHLSIYLNLVEKHKLREIQLTIEPIYLKDLENLNTKKIEFERAVDEYSPMWLIKNFQKNLNRILNSLNNITNCINCIDINIHKQYGMGIVNVSYTGKSSILIHSLTIGNYKYNYIRDPEQKTIESCIRALQSNLSLLANTINSMTIDFQFTHRYTFHRLNPMPSYSISSSKYPSEYDTLSNCIRELMKYMEEVNNLFENFKVMPIRGVVKEAVYEQRFDPNDDMTKTVLVSDQVLGVVNVTFNKPHARNFYFNFQLNFPDHWKFKQTRKDQQTNLDQIENSFSKLKYKDTLQQEINELEYKLTAEHLHSVTQNQVDQCINEFIYKDLLQIIDTKTIVIHPENMFSAFGAITDRISFRKWKLFKVAPKPQIRTSITLNQFLKTFGK